MPSVVEIARSAVIAVVPEEPLQKVRAYRRTSNFREAGVVFVHVPKAAGTSLSDALYGRIIGHFGIQDVLDYCPKDVLALPRFAVVRNPWDRLVSAWAFARAGSGAGDGVKARIRNARRYSAPVFATFDTFLTDWLANQDLNRLDPVFRPQAAYARAADGTMPFDHIGRVERLPETIAWLSERLGRELPLRRVNASNHKDFRTYYTPATKAVVARLYADDVEAFGYDF